MLTDPSTVPGPRHGRGHLPRQAQQPPSARWEPTPHERAAAVASLYPEVPLGGWAAARLLGVPDMDGRSAGTQLPVLLCPGRSGRVRRRGGIATLRSPLCEDDVVDVRGTAVTSPLRTAFDLARTAADVWAAVEEIDCVFRGRDPAFLQRLAAYAGERPRWKGVGRVHRAAALASTLTSSRGETWLRLVWTELAGLPPPQVNVPLGDTAGHHLGRPDLLDEASGLAGEYDGAGHRTAAQQHADTVRAELFAAAGLTLLRASAVDRRQHPGLLARRIISAHARAQRVGVHRWSVSGR